MPTGTAHFSPQEFACPHCEVALVRPLLLFKLERLRVLVRRPIVIVSGYRCPVHNAAVHGAADSQHMYAAAADVHRGVCTLDEAQRIGFTGIGTLDGQPVHLDVRDGPPATWIY